jgi:seryl-tRNA synthetase
MIALLETYQKEDGSIEIPSILQPYVKKETISIP